MNPATTAEKPNWMTAAERDHLRQCLHGNSTEAKPMYMGRDTSFVGGDGASTELPENAVSQISLLAVHY